MSAEPHESFTEALEELRRTQERLQSVRRQLHDKATKVTSKDGMVTITLDGSSEVTSITFNTSKFRRMAPAELGTVLVDTISRARAEGRERALSAYRPFLPEGMDLKSMLAGKFNIDKLFDDARHRADTLMADGRPGAHDSQTSRKG